MQAGRQKDPVMADTQASIHPSSTPDITHLIQPSRLPDMRVENGIHKFTPDISYSTGNFSKLREKHARLQLDSVNGTTDRMDTMLRRTNWPRDFWKGKLVLECGCGAGPDTETMLALGARVVAVDLAGLTQAQANLNNHPNLTLVQASLMDLPFQEKTFDIVFCHRVIQHTPDPAHVLRHILTFVKDDGHVFVHSYGRTFRQMFNWKYALLPLTRRINPDTLYAWVERAAPVLYKISNFISRFGWPGRYIAETFVPLRNYRLAKKFAGKDDDFILEYAVHDTFDALSPPYDSPMSRASMHAIATARGLKTPFEVVYMYQKTVTLLRSIIV